MANNSKSPSSYFFTELGFTQYTNPTHTVLDSAVKSFGQLDSNTFQITTTFKGSLNAFAVVKGTILIARQEGTTDKINILLRPTGDIGLGIKIKYFVYRGIDASDYFKNFASTPSVKETSSLEFIINAWDAFTEFNETTGDFEASKIGLIDASSGINTDVLKKYFKEGEYNLLKVDWGSPLGKFATDSGGFEIVLDEGDFLQQNSDTGLVFTDKFATAKECILKSDGDHSDLKIFGGNSSNVEPKIFKENIFKFIDPAAFYGSHVTNNATNANTGSICVGGTSVFYSSMSDIYNQFIKKFKNRLTTYFYVKGYRNRNLNFYDSTINSIKINGSVQNLATVAWPMLSFDSVPNRFIEITNLKPEDSLYSSTLLKASGALSIPQEDYLFTRVIGSYTCNLPFTAISGSNRVYSSFTYLFFNSSAIDKNECLFGPINLDSIFEQADFTGKKIATVNHLRPILIRQNEDVGYYNTKVVLDGYISDSDPVIIPTDPATLAKTLRTYVLFPQNTEVQFSTNSKNLNAGYYGLLGSSAEYCTKIYGGGEIWKGVIKDNTTEIKSLLYRRKDNDDEMPIYQLGISQLDYNTLVDRVADPNNIDQNATNLFFHFEGESVDASGSFLKYTLRIRYDKPDGTTAETNASIKVYTIDGYFFFTQNYSDNFESKYCKEFANIAIDFLPYNLSSYINGYECGFDYMGFEGRENYIEIIGKYYNSSGNLENVEDSNVSSLTFSKNKISYFNLLNRFYNHKPTNWRTLFPFHTDSFITLYSEKHTMVQCKLTKVSAYSGKLFYRYNARYISIDDSTASVTDKIVTKEITSFVDHTIKVKALQVFEKNQLIEVISMEEGKEKVAGKLWLINNSERLKIRIALINVKTQIKTSLNEGLIQPTDITLTKKILENFLKQAYINPFEYIEKTLDLSNDSRFKIIASDIGEHISTFSILGGIPAYGIKDDAKVFNDCFDKLKTIYPSVNFENYLVLFFINEFGGDNGGLLGIADSIGGLKGARIFKNGLLKNTIAHEALHSIALYHSFDNDGQYTFHRSRDQTDISLKTDNLMDYFSENLEDSKRKLIWRWQMGKIWKINNNAKLIKE